MNIKNWKLFLEELVGNNPISDLQKYIDGMSLSIKDKLFFVDIVDFDIIVDFGCADGTFLEKIISMNPNIKIIGYDLDDSMLKKARIRLGEKAILTNDWNEVIKNLNNFKNPLLNLSSVIHEVYSYSNSRTIKKFWEEQVFGNNFKWITIRDMIPSIELTRNEIYTFREDVKKVRIKSDRYYLKSFEDKWGSINNNYRAFIHYLLKYKYIDNWDREVNEDYLPVSLETMKTKIPNSYSIVYENDFLLEYMKKEVKKDFGIELTHSTHTKMIIKNNKF